MNVCVCVCVRVRKRRDEREKRPKSTEVQRRAQGVTSRAHKASHSAQRRQNAKERGYAAKMSEREKREEER